MTVAALDRRSRSWVPVALALAQRSLVGILRIPAAVVPLVVMPMFFVIAFSGSFSRLSSLPSFPTDNVFNWFVPFGIIQGSAFAGFGANTPYHNTMQGIAMLLGRFVYIVPMLAVAGSLAAKKSAPPSSGTFPTHGPLFVTLLDYGIEPEPD